jgi:hypothetical protein
VRFRLTPFNVVHAISRGDGRLRGDQRLSRPVIKGRPGLADLYVKTSLNW